MPKSKNVLFITHHNNDLDHFLPLAVHLKKDKKMNIKMIAFFTEHELLKNKLHKYICDSNEINFDSMLDVMNFRFLNKAIFKIYKYAIMNRGLSNPIRTINCSTPNVSKQKIDVLKNKLLKTISFFKYPKISLLKMLDFILIRYVVLCSLIFVTKKNMLNYIDSNNIDLVIIDHREIEQSLLDYDPFRRFINVFIWKSNYMNLALFRVTKVARDMNIPVFMMPHGPQPIFISGDEGEKLINPFNPDYLVVSSQNDLIVNPHMQSRKSTFFLGDPRFDIDWINYLESCALKVYEGMVEKPKDKKVLLYLMDNAIFTKNGNLEYKYKMNKDILSLVNHFSDLEIWAKHHPRNVFEILFENYIKKERLGNIKQFGNDFDTNVLLAKADICISAASTTFISPILQKRPVIFYNRWEDNIEVPSIFNKLNFIASSEEELVVQYNRIINGEYSIEEDVLKSIYKNTFSSDSLFESMVEKYSEKIIGILESQ